MKLSAITIVEPNSQKLAVISKLLIEKKLPFFSAENLRNIQSFSPAEEQQIFLIAESLVSPGELQNFISNVQISSKQFPAIIILTNQFQLDKKHQYENQGLVGVLLYEVFERGIAVDLMQPMVEKWKRKPIGKVALSKDSLYAAPRFDIPFGKRLFDFVASATAILFLLPFFLIIALLIKKDSKGPIFYISKRVGQGFQIFDFYKFRTMIPDADKKLKDISHLNQYASNRNGPTEVAVGELCASCASEGIPCAFPLFTDKGFVCEKLLMERENNQSESFNKFTNDPRVTKLGHFLRNTSIDELPQLFNVLKGDMSIVGNRPLPLYEAEKLTTNEISQRFIAPAGITGLWQVKKRGRSTEMSPEERMQLDNDYAKHYNWWFDLKIILMTIPALLQKENV
jgi:lipopolysaccharide/colanic/teichoic acid biosynthesis glycosyltransferase